MSDQSNVIEISKAEKPESFEDELEKISPEEMEKMQEQSAKEIEKSRIEHLRGSVINPYVARADFQQSIVESILHKPDKTNSLCESYLEWARIQSKVVLVDYSDVAKEADVIIERYRQVFPKNSITVNAHFGMAITTFLKSQKGDLRKLIFGFGIWIEAEIIADELFKKPTLLQRIFKK